MARTSALLGGGASAYGSVAYESNRLYPTMGLPNQLNAGYLTGYVCYCPFIPRAEMTVDGIAFDRYAAGAASVRVGIYETDSAGMPGALMAQAEHTTAGVATVVQAITAQTLEKNKLYWVALNTNTNSVVSAADPSTSNLSTDTVPQVAGWAEGVDISSPRAQSGNLQVTAAYGSLADPAVTTSIAGAFRAPYIALRTQ